MTVRRRRLLAASASLLAAPAAFTQTGHAGHAGHAPALPVAPSSPDPYARLQGGVPHHLTPDQEAQRSFNSPAPAGPQGRWPDGRPFEGVRFMDRFEVAGGLVRRQEVWNDLAEARAGDALYSTTSAL